jgi:hypothetical protein
VALVLLPQFRHLSSVPVCFDPVSIFSKPLSSFPLFFEALTHLDLSGEYLATISFSGLYHGFFYDPSKNIPALSQLALPSTLLPMLAGLERNPSGLWLCLGPPSHTVRSTHAFASPFKSLPNSVVRPGLPRLIPSCTSNPDPADIWIPTPSTRLRSFRRSQSA